MTFLHWFNGFIDFFSQFIYSRSIDIALALAIVAMVWKTVRAKVPAQFGYYLFLLVLLKPLIPVQYPLSVTASGLSAFMDRIIPDHVAASPDRELDSKDILDQTQRQEIDSIPNFLVNRQETPLENDPIPESEEEMEPPDQDAPSSVEYASDDQNDDESKTVVFESTAQFDSEPGTTDFTPSPDAQSQERSSGAAASIEREPQKIDRTIISTEKPERTQDSGSGGLTVYLSLFFARFLTPYLSTFWESFSWIPFLIASWIAVALGLLARFVYDEWRTVRTIRTSEPVNPDQLPVCFSQLLKIAGVKRRVRLATHDWVKSPFVCGIWRPTLLIPRDFSLVFTEKQIRWILLHELAHIQRWDTLVKLYQKIIQYIFFFHPAVWIASRIVDRQREYACDAAAVYGSNISLHDCGESFLRVVFQSNHVQKPVPGLLGLTNSKQIVKERLMRILDHNRKLPFSLSPPMAAFLLGVTFAVLLFGGSVTAEDASSTVQAIEVAATSDASADAASAPLAVGSGSAPQAVEASKKPYPTEGWTYDENERNYIWTRSLQVKPADIKRVELLTQDGDIVIQPQKDPAISMIDAEAAIVIHVNDKKANVTEEEILAVKKEVEAVSAIENNTFFFRSDIPKETPKGVSISVNLTVFLPPSIAAVAKSDDGDITAEGVQAALEMTSSDGDLTATECKGTVRAVTQDGDINLTEIQDRVEANTQDGDITITSGKGGIHASTQDGDIILTEIAENTEAVSQDGDIVVTDSKGTVHAVTQDGDIVLTTIVKDIETTTQEGDIVVTTCNGNVSATAIEGDIVLTDAESNVKATTTEGDITTTGCKGPIQVRNESGAIVLEGVEKRVEAVSKEGDITVKYAVSPPEDCIIQNDDASVSVSIPENSKATLNLKTDEGVIHFEMSSFTGTSEEKNVQGTLNGGGPTIKIQTGDGEIFLQNE